MKIFAATSRWSLALAVALLLVGVSAWLTVTLRMLPQPHEAELQSKTTTHMIQRAAAPTQ